MRLGFILLNNTNNINSFQEVQALSVIRGNKQDLYFRLIDLDQNNLRYIPDVAGTISVSFKHIDSTKTINKTATKPYIDDRSIWKVSLLSTDEITNNSMAVSLTIGSDIYLIKSVSILSVGSIGSDANFC